MASYATIDDMRARFPEQRLIELTDLAETGDVNEILVQRQLNDADALIDGYVGRYYNRLDAALPVPPALTAIACAITYYNLWGDMMPPDKAKADFEAAIVRLRDIAAGKFKLDQGEEKLPERDGQILVQSSDRLFTRDSMRNG